MTLPPDFPRIVVLCGSTRFRDAYEQALREETLKGHIVLSVGLFGHQEGLDMTGPAKVGLDELHKRKVDLCDEVLVLDVPQPCCPVCGVWWRPDLPGAAYPFPLCSCSQGMEERPYIGSSTRGEIEYAQAHGKTVRYWSKERLK